MGIRSVKDCSAADPYWLHSTVKVSDVKEGPGPDVDHFLNLLSQLSETPPYCSLSESSMLSKREEECGDSSQEARPTGLGNWAQWSG